MDREDVFDLLQDASQEYLQRLEENGLVAKNVYLEDGEVEEEYALTDAGMEYFEVEGEEAVFGILEGFDSER